MSSFAYPTTRALAPRAAASSLASSTVCLRKCLARNFSGFSLHAERRNNSNAWRPKFQALVGQRRSVFIIAETTPNPESVMFYPQGSEVLGKGAKTKTFAGKHDPEVKSSLLANSLFKVHGVQGVMMAARHVTVTKNPDSDWDLVQRNVELVMSQFFAAGLEPMDPTKIEYYETGILPLGE